MIELPLAVADKHAEYLITVRDPKQDVVVTLSYNGAPEFRDTWSLSLRRAQAVVVEPAPLDSQLFKKLAAGDAGDRRLLRLALLELSRFYQWRYPEQAPLPLLELFLAARTRYEKWEVTYMIGMSYKSRRNYEKAVPALAEALKMLEDTPPEDPIEPLLQWPAEYFTRLMLAACLNILKKYAEGLRHARAAGCLHVRMLDWGGLPERHLGHWGVEGRALEGLNRWAEAAYKYLEATELSRPRLQLLYRVRRLLEEHPLQLAAFPDIASRYECALRREFADQTMEEADRLLVRMFKEK